MIMHMSFLIIFRARPAQMDLRVLEEKGLKLLI